MEQVCVLCPDGRVFAERNSICSLALTSYTLLAYYFHLHVVKVDMVFTFLVNGISVGNKLFEYSSQPWRKT